MKPFNLPDAAKAFPLARSAITNSIIHDNAGPAWDLFEVHGMFIDTNGRPYRAATVLTKLPKV